MNFDFILLIVVSISMTFILYKMMIKVYIVTKIRQASNIETYILRPENVVIKHQYTSLKTSMQSVNILPHINGFIEKVFVRQGQHVKTGELLFTIQQRQYLVQKEIAQSHLKQAQSLLNQAQQYLNKLETQKDVSQSELNRAEQSFLMAQSNLMKAEHEFKIADTNYAYTFICAPIEGIVQQLNVLKGNYVSPAGKVLAKIINAVKTNIVIQMTKNQYLQYVKNKEVDTVFKIQLFNNTAFTQSGVLKKVEEEGFSQENMVNLYLDFPHFFNHSSTLDSVYVSMECKQKNVLLVDENVIYHSGKRSYVYLAFQGKIKRRAILIGEKIGHRYIVKKGLNPNDELITTVIKPIQIGYRIVSHIRRIYLNKIVLERKIKGLKA